MSLLETLADLFTGLGIPFRVGQFAPQAPTTFAVAEPLGDDLDLFADGQPLVEIEEVRISLFTKGNYLPLRDEITRALLEADVTILERTYVGVEDDTGYHHYAVDVAAHHTI